MMICKFCQAEVEDDSVFCPVCGKELEAAEEVQMTEETAETEVLEETVEAAETAETVETVEVAEAAETVPEKKTASRKMIVICVAAIVVVAALLIGLVFWGAGGKAGSVSDVGTLATDGNPDDVTCKGSYTYSDRKAASKANKVVATMGNVELTNSELQVYYWMMIDAFRNGNGTVEGLDYSIPLDRQICPTSEEGWTWQQYFVEGALTSWQMYTALCMEADAAEGFDVDADTQAYLDQVKAALESAAADQEFASADEMLHKDMGPAASLEAYLNYTKTSYKGYAYYNQLMTTLVPTEDQIEAVYTQYEDLFTQQGFGKEDRNYVNVRHILLMPEGGTTDEAGITTYSDVEWKACETAAQAVLDEWLAGEKTEESFAALALAHSVDPGSKSNGGLYEYVEPGQMVPAFDSWCFDPENTYGDYGLVKTEYGYHIMFMSHPVWYGIAYEGAQSDLLNETVERIIDKYPSETDYSKIVLSEAGFLSLQ